MEAYFAMGRLRSGFLLYRCFGTSHAASTPRTPLDDFQLPCPEQKNRWCGRPECIWCGPASGLGGLAGHCTRPPVPGSHDASGGGSTVRRRLGLPSLRATGRAQGYGNQSI